jgi:hypothetical protein
MHRSVLAIVMPAALLVACAAEPLPLAEDPAQRATMQVIGHHCDGGRGIDALAVHVDKPGVAVIRWKNKNVCGGPA